MLAAWVAEAATHERYDDLIATRVWRPFGMTGATFDAAEVERGDFAYGHVPRAGGVLQTYAPSDYDCIPGHPAGFTFATVLDFAHYMEGLLAGGGEALAPATVEQMLAAHFPMPAASSEEAKRHQAYGLARSTFRGVTVLMHPGSQVGFEAFILFSPERQWGVAIVHNLSHVPARALAFKAASHLEP